MFVETLFLKCVNISIRATWFLLAILVMRAIFQKTSNKYRMWLWAFLGIRLICPFSFESIFSFLPTGDTIPSDIAMMEKPMITSGVQVIDKTVNPVLVENYAPAVGNSANPLQILTHVLSILWVVGIVAMLCYFLYSTLKLKKKVRSASLVRDNIYETDVIGMPFVLGMFSPKIYLPKSLTGEERDNIILHEETHIKRYDCFIKPLAFIILGVYWFNPLLWVAYRLLGKDIELRCDEEVLGHLNETGRKSYASALLECAYNRHALGACPVAFGEADIKNRIKSILNYKKHSFWVGILMIALCLVVGIGFMSDPKRNSSAETGVEPNAGEEGEAGDETPADGGEETSAPGTTDEGNAAMNEVEEIKLILYDEESMREVRFYRNDSKLVRKFMDVCEELKGITESNKYLLILEPDMAYENIDDGVISAGQYGLAFWDSDFSDMGFKNAYYISLYEKDAEGEGFHDKYFIMDKNLGLCQKIMQIVDNLKGSEYMEEVAEEESEPEDTTLLGRLGRSYGGKFIGDYTIMELQGIVNGNELLFELTTIAGEKETGKFEARMIVDNIEELYGEGDSFKAELVGFQAVFGDFIQDGRKNVHVSDDYIAFVLLDSDDNVIINSGTTLTVRK